MSEVVCKYTGIDLMEYPKLVQNWIVTVIKLRKVKSDVLVVHSPEEVASGPRILCWVMFFSLSKFSQPERISSVNFTAGPWMLNQPVILRQPFQHKNLCWDDCTFGRVWPLSHTLTWDTVTREVLRCTSHINNSFDVPTEISLFRGTLTLLQFHGRGYQNLVQFHVLQSKMHTVKYMT